MRPYWLYLLLILALLMPGARPRYISASIASGAPVEGIPTTDTSETEEQEVNEKTVTSRHRLSLTATRSLDPRPVVQRQRFPRSLSAVPGIVHQSHNGFGGDITC
ncbi:hypothetical protein AB1L30_25160 [Bremerella sp. JC817]|uniref:hypothetical protein n=1 Tax=Bremerella sp. JC817 TaxID=3231756 RepID=UPI0034588F9E